MLVLPISVKSQIENFALSLCTYADELQNACAVQTSRQNDLYPTKQVRYKTNYITIFLKVEYIKYHCAASKTIALYKISFFNSLYTTKLLKDHT